MYISVSIFAFVCANVLGAIVLKPRSKIDVQGAAAISEENLRRCCEPGNENIVGSSSLTCSPGGKNHISVSQRPPLGEMWRQEQFR